VISVHILCLRRLSQTRQNHKTLKSLTLILGQPLTDDELMTIINGEPGAAEGSVH
jgi:hypothetical protein